MDGRLTIEQTGEALKRLLVMFVVMTGAGFAAAMVAYFDRSQAATVVHPLRNAVLRLLWLAQAASRRGCKPIDPGPPELPVMLPREPYELLNAQNIAQRRAALYRAWDDLMDEAGRCIRWRARQDREAGIFFSIQPTDRNPFESDEPVPLRGLAHCLLKIDGSCGPTARILAPDTS